MFLTILAYFVSLSFSQLIDLGACSSPPCFRIKNQCPFEVHAFGLGGCCTAFGTANPSTGIANDGRVHEYPMGCTAHGRIAFGPNDANSNDWYAGPQVYSLVEPGPSAGCAGINYDTSYIDTGFLIPLAVRAQPCPIQAFCNVSYSDAIRSAPAGWVKNLSGSNYVWSYSKFCNANPNNAQCEAVRASAKKLSQAVGTCNDPQVDSRPISQITGCGGGPWSANSGCCSAVNFGLVDYILKTNSWNAWNANSNCATFYPQKYTSAYNLYQKWIEDTCRVKYQYGFPYADHCGWSSDINCNKPSRMDIILCPLN